MAHGSSHVRGQIRATAVAYIPDTATWDPSHIWNLCRGLQQRQILNPLSEARDQTRILTDTMSGSSPPEPQHKLLQFFNILTNDCFVFCFFLFFFITVIPVAVKWSPIGFSIKKLCAVRMPVVSRITENKAQCLYHHLQGPLLTFLLWLTQLQSPRPRNCSWNKSHSFPPWAFTLAVPA